MQAAPNRLQCSGICYADVGKPECITHAYTKCMIHPGISAWKYEVPVSERAAYQFFCEFWKERMIYLQVHCMCVSSLVVVEKRWVIFCIEYYLVHSLSTTRIIILDTLSTDKYSCVSAFVITSDVEIHDTVVYHDSLGHNTIHDTLSLCIVSPWCILNLEHSWARLNVWKFNHQLHVWTFEL